MKMLKHSLKLTTIAVAAALTFVAAPAFMSTDSALDTVLAGLFPEASAAQADGKGHQGAGGGQGGGGSQGAGGQGGKTGMDKVLEADDDSDRPPWAGGDPGENPHSGGGDGKPDSAGTMKGDEYGDLIVLLRDPVTGAPIMEDGEYLVCLDAACTQTEPTVDGEVPAGVTPIEVDFGRAAVARSPDNVIDKALTDAITKLTADGVVLGTDPAGRITYTVDGITISTIDSPLENLALYIDLVNGLASDSTSAAETALGDLATLNTAAALFAGVADKTGDIGIDYLVYQNVITDVAEQGDYYDYDGFSYTRDYPDDYTYFLQVGDEVETRTLDVNVYLADVNGGLPTGEAALFAAAADDALEVIELVHTQIHTVELPGTQ
jgi:hypothetical protein